MSYASHPDGKTNSPIKNEGKAVFGSIGHTLVFMPCSHVWHHKLSNAQKGGATPLPGQRYLCEWIVHISFQFFQFFASASHGE
ncbi:hypothetical protein AB0L53_47680 [Nonomuraea sp. NPDC052129]|uniref:hypothetical protein n=1 Tax=Nonomuraea sp. NPDC052129 TaxID=3154651 RepID=UPI0034456B04